MYLIPSKSQWKKWSLPSKMTAVGLYISLGTIIFGVVSYIAITANYHLSKVYSIDENIVSKNTFQELMDGNYESRSEKINVRYPTIDSLMTSDFILSINEEIEENALSYLDESIMEYEFDYEVGIESDELLSIKMEQYYYYHMAMNGNSSIFTIIINPSSNSILDFFDIFDARLNALGGIKKIIKSKLLESSCNGLFEDIFNKASFIPRFHLKYKEIEFVFSEYEITPGVCGSVAVNVGYDEVVEFIDRDGPLGRIVPASGTWQAEHHFVSGVMGRLKESRKPIKND